MNIRYEKHSLLKDGCPHSTYVLYPGVCFGSVGNKKQPWNLG